MACFGRFDAIHGRVPLGDHRETHPIRATTWPAWCSLILARRTSIERTLSSRSSGNLAIRHAAEQQIENLAACGRQSANATPNPLGPGKMALVTACPLQGRVNRVAKLVVSARFLQEIDRAKFHRMHGRRNVGSAGDGDHRQMLRLHSQMTQKLQINLRAGNVQQNAAAEGDRRFGQLVRRPANIGRPALDPSCEQPMIAERSGRLQ